MGDNGIVTGITPARGILPRGSRCMSADSQRHTHCAAPRAHEQTMGNTAPCARYHLTIFLPVLLLALLSAWPTLAQQSDPVVSNVQVNVRGNYVDITYDLEQAEGLSCVVQPYLSKDGGLTFNFPVISMTGDFGKEVTPGSGKKIVWDALKDYPNEHISEAGLLVDAFIQEETILLPGGVPLVMVRIPAGAYLMGRYPGEQESHATREDPRHLVTVPRFWMAKYELTKRQ